MDRGNFIFQTYPSTSHSSANHEMERFEGEKIGRYYILSRIFAEIIFMVHMSSSVPGINHFDIVSSYLSK